MVKLKRPGMKKGDEENSSEAVNAPLKIGPRRCAAAQLSRMRGRNAASRAAVVHMPV